MTAPEERAITISLGHGPSATPGYVVGLVLVSVGAVVAFSEVLARLDLHGPPIPLNVGAKLLTATVALATIDRLGWWRRVGFRAPLRWTTLWLCWLPALYLYFVSDTAFPRSTVVRSLSIASLALAVGLEEEVWTRGLLLETLRPRGTTRAVVLSAAFFGLLHGLNLISGQPISSTLVQMFVALSFGLGLGAIRVRTLSIWPCILIHAAWDFSLILRSGHIGDKAGTDGHQAILTLAIMAPLALYGLFLARPSKFAEASDPAPQPEPVPAQAPASGAHEGVSASPTSDSLGPWPAPPAEVVAIFRGW